MKNKTLIRMSIVMWGIVAVLSIMIFVTLFLKGGRGMSFFNFIGDFGFDDRDFVEVKKFVSEDDVSDIHVDWIAGRVNVFKSSTQEIKAIQRGPLDFEESRKMSASISSGKLEIIDNNNRNAIISFGFQSFTNLELYLPEKLYNTVLLKGIAASVEFDNLEANRLEVDTTSGSIKAGGKFTDMNLHSTSGSIKAYDIVTEKLTAKNVSGSIKISGTAGKVDLRSTSGSIKAEEGLVSKNIYAKSVSGSIDLFGEYEEVEMGSTSGSVRLDSDTMLTKLYCKSTSGSTAITIPENSGFSVDVHKASGSFHSDFPMVQNGDSYTYQSGGPRFEMRATSGSLKIYKK